MRPLYLISDGTLAKDPGSLITRLETALRIAANVIGYFQLREPAISNSNTFVYAQELRAICANHGVKFLVNRNVELAQALAADGLHVGGEHMPLDELQAKLGQNKIVGISTHSVPEAYLELEQGFSYAFLSPIFQPLSKETAKEPLGLESLRELRSMTPGIFFALGGINASRASDSIAAGASGVATIGGILAAPDVKAAATEFSNCLSNETRAG